MNKRKWITWTIVLVLVTNLITLVGSNMISLYIPNGKVIISKQEYNNIMKFEKLFQVRNSLYRYYDGKINDNILAEGTIKGMTSSLKDPYTVFMNKKEFEEFNSQTEGTYSGVGLQVEAKNNKISIAYVFENSPAKKAGILPKDEIEKVNDTNVSGKDLEKAATLMRGKEGTEVNLTLYRKEKGRYTVKLKRQKIHVATVKGEMLDKDTGYISVAIFNENVGKEFKEKLYELKNKGMKSLIIDLRGNPGGILDECIKMASNFIEKNKVIVSTIDKYKHEKKYKSKGGDFIGLPLVVLTDKGSASASEIFSGAIRDHKAGKLVGKTTFGKGLVQVILDTGDGTALKVTVSKYYTPNGENIQGKGIKPDIEVDYPESLFEKPYDRNKDPQFNKALEVVNNIVK